MKIKYSKIYIYLMAVYSLFTVSCKKLVEVDPPTTKITNSVVFNNDDAAISVLIGLYTKLSLQPYTGTANPSTISLFAGLSADEFTLYSGAGVNRKAYYQNALNANTAGTEFWTSTYPYIFSCNSAINGLNVSTGLTPAVKKQLLGEAEFLRAFFYFYLVNLYGDVPLILTDDYTKTVALPRSPQTLVYQQIISDLKDAQSKLNPGYIEADGMTAYPNSAAERVRPNSYTATALLSRVYLYTQKWDSAEAQATSIINNSDLYSLVPLNSVFLKNSSEAIWQWQPVSSGNITNTPEALAFILSAPPAGLNITHPVYLSADLLDSFEVGDQRTAPGNWVNTFTDVTGTYYYAYKYKDATMGIGVTPTEYKTIFRLGEQYLIRAEARAEQANIDGAQADLNIIRTRAGLSNTSASDQPTLLAAVYHERQVELFSEMGQRWLDLKRTGMVDAVMSLVTPQKASGAQWQSYQQLYPILPSDIQKDPKLIQNSGY